jgi:tetratricopeptide (TPR) repeat protein
MQLKAIVILILSWCLSGFGQNISGANAREAVQSALRMKDYAQALHLAASELQRSPRDARLWTLQALAFAGLGKDREALTAYDRSLSISPNYLPALEGAAGLEYKEGDVHAIPRLNRILDQLPNDPTSHAMLAMLAYKQHDCQTAVKHFAQVTQIISGQPAALAGYGSCLMDLERAPEAVPIFQTLVNRFPDDPRARYDLAVAELANHQAKDAAETLQPMIEVKELNSDVLALASSIYEEQGDTPKAVELLRRAIVSNPEKVKYYLDFATLSFNHQSFQVGIDMLNVGLKRKPNAASLYVARGVLYIQLAQFDQGQADFQTAMRLDPSQGSGAVAEGMSQIQQSNLDQALATVESQLKSHDKDAFLYYMKAQIVVQKGAAPGSPEFKEAVTAAARATQLNPEFFLARDILGSLYLKSGRLDLAIEQCRLALKGNPSDQESLYHLIQALRQRGTGSKPEMADLVKRLEKLRRESHDQEVTTTKYKLYETAPAENGKDATPPQ